MEELGRRASAEEEEVAAMEAMFEAHAATTSRGKRVPKEWDDDTRKEFKRWSSRRRNAACKARKRQKLAEGDETTVAQREEIRRKDRERRKVSNMTKEQHERRRERARVAEVKYRNKDPERYREIQNASAQAPHRKEQKRKFYEEHKERWLQYGRDARERGLAEDPVAYRAKLAEYARQFRTTEKYREYYEKSKSDIKRRWQRWLGTCAQRERKVTIDCETYTTLVLGDCLYCGLPAVEHLYGLNGIDRYDNDLDYTEENCVSCCFACNRSKHTVHGDRFLAANYVN